MTKEFAEADVKTQPGIEGIDFTSSGELVQANRGDALAASASTEISHWQLAHEEAVEYWLTEYQPQPDAPNLEKVRGYLEAFHHCCEVEDWEKASEILCIGIDTPTNEGLHAQLGTWGYYSQQIEVYSRLLGKLNDSCDIICWAGIGNACQSLAKYRQAMRYHHKCVLVAREIGDRYGEGSALGNLGIAYNFLGDYRQAIEYHQQSLTIFREIGDRNGEGSALGNLGNAQDLRKYAICSGSQLR